ncbi:Protocadherin-10 [Liparis tanakae]|uniref:Protocadherin-10 n=1 Tax=Liparis tanakae TaxID=230148 RepID=A0A4Z2FNJ4_9TELE|nr:Protocadherin-10 [Liparis tanakae]
MSVLHLPSVLALVALSPAPSLEAQSYENKIIIVFLFARADLFSNCTEECKALGHSDRCWMPSFVPSDGRQGPDYRSNLHVPGMDATLPDTEPAKGFVSSFHVDLSETA